MAPMFGQPNFIWSSEDSRENSVESSEEYDDVERHGLKEMAFWYMIMLVAILLIWLVVFFCLRLITLRQKTRAPPQRRMYMPRARQSLPQSEPTIYVSPNNLPPPPKYECLAPPSYEEVVGIHYPQYQSQPITHPITNAMAQTAQTSSHVNSTDPPTVVTVTSETRTSVQVAAS